MKSLNQFIQEKYLIDMDSDGQNFTDEELRDDYNKVAGCITKAEKNVFSQKYGIKANKIREIQIAILDQLKNNRQDKKKFDDDDIYDFLQYDIKEKEFNKYLDDEPIEFVKTMYDYYKKYCEKRKIIQYAQVINQRDWNYRMSYSDRNQLKKYITLRNYLEQHNYKL